MKRIKVTHDCVRAEKKNIWGNWHHFKKPTEHNFQLFNKFFRARTIALHIEKTGRNTLYDWFTELKPLGFVLCYNEDGDNFQLRYEEGREAIKIAIFLGKVL